MKTSGDEPLPSTIAVPLLGDERRDQESWAGLVSESVALSSLAFHDTCESSEETLEIGPAPWEINGDRLKVLFELKSLVTPESTILTGAFLLVVVPSPSLPLTFEPVAQRELSFLRINAWESPTATFLTPLSKTAERLEVFV